MDIVSKDKMDSGNGAEVDGELQQHPSPFGLEEMAAFMRDTCLFNGAA